MSKYNRSFPPPAAHSYNLGTLRALYLKKLAARKHCCDIRGTETVLLWIRNQPSCLAMAPTNVISFNPDQDDGFETPRLKAAPSKAKKSMQAKSGGTMTSRTTAHSTVGAVMDELDKLQSQQITFQRKIDKEITKSRYSRPRFRRRLTRLTTIAVQRRVVRL